MAQTSDKALPHRPHTHIIFFFHTHIIFFFKALYSVPRMITQWQMQRHGCVEPTNSALVSQYCVYDAAVTETILHRHAEMHTKVCKYTQGNFPAANMHCLVLSLFYFVCFSILHTWLLHSAHHYGLFVVTGLLNGKYFEPSICGSVSLLFNTAN